MASPGAMRLSDLRAAARQASDTEADPHISDVELNLKLSQSAFELYDLLVAAYGDNYFLVYPDYVFTTDGSHDVFPFPDGSPTYKLNDGVTIAPAVYKPLGLDLSTAQGQLGTWITLRPFMNAERNNYAIAGQAPFLGAYDLRYNFRGNNLWFNQVPAGGQTLRILYVPRMTPLSDVGTVTLSGVVAGDALTINGTTWTAATNFLVGASDSATATNLAAAINASALAGITAYAGPQSVSSISGLSGLGGNQVAIALSGATVAWSSSGPRLALSVPMQAPGLSVWTDILDGLSGWTDYVIVDAAIRCLGKQESDNTDLKQQKADLKARINSMKVNRNAGHPKLSQRVRRNQWAYDYPWQGGRGPFGLY